MKNNLIDTINTEIDSLLKDIPSNKNTFFNPCLDQEGVPTSFGANDYDVYSSGFTSGEKEGALNVYQKLKQIIESK